MARAHYMAETFLENRRDALEGQIMRINHDRKAPIILTDDNPAHMIFLYEN